MRIESESNKRYKMWLSLKQKKYRDRLGLFLIDETKLIEEALSEGAAVEALVVREGSEGNLPQSGRAPGGGAKTLEPGGRPEVPGQSGRAPAAQGRIPFYELPEKLFGRLSGTETSRGVMAVVRKPESRPGCEGAAERPGCESAAERPGCEGAAERPGCESAAERPGGESAEKRSDCLLVLDRIQDPGNVGTLIRTADAAGYSGIAVIKGTADIYSQKVLRSTAGSVFRMNFMYFDSGEELIDFAKKNKFRLTVSCFEGAVDYREADYGEKTALVVGNEGKGASENLIKAADLRVKIPMYGSIESLNASVAAGIIMYETVKNRIK